MHYAYLLGRLRIRLKNLEVVAGAVGRRMEIAEGLGLSRLRSADLNQTKKPPRGVRGGREGTRVSR